METKYCLKVTKETEIYAKTYDEALSIADMMMAREMNDTLFGSLVVVSSDVTEMSKQ